MRPAILVITPIDDIPGVRDILQQAGEVAYLSDPIENDVLAHLHHYDALFTNPNKSKVFLSKKLMDAAPKLRAICTASTGTNHIDLLAAQEKKIRVFSLTEERQVIDRISSTAEHAFALMLAALRKIPQGWESVKKGDWDYEPFRGRQLDHLKIGIVGYGRLGKLFARYAHAFRAEVLAYDPYKMVSEEFVRQTDLDTLLNESDIVSLHVHATTETQSMINEDCFSKMKQSVLIVNTARGDVVDEKALVKFLQKNPDAFYATDVLSDEIRHRMNSPILCEALAGSNQILITPHIGGMTREGQGIAYRHAASMLSNFLGQNV